MKRYIELDSGKSEQLALESEQIIKRWILDIVLNLGGWAEFMDDKQVDAQKSAKFVGVIESTASYSDKFEPTKIHSALKKEARKLQNRKRFTLNNPYLWQNLNSVKELVGLNVVEIKILLFTLLIHQNDALYEAANLLGDINSHEVCNILSYLLCESRADINNALSSNSKLFETGLVKLDLGDYDLRRKLDIVSSSFADIIFSTNFSLKILIEEFAKHTPAPRLSINDYEHISAELSLVISHLTSLKNKDNMGTNIFVYGPPGTGKSQLSRLIAQEIGSTAFEIVSQDERGHLMDGEDRFRALAAAQSFLNNQSALIVFDEAEDVFNNDSLFDKSTASKNKAWCNTLLENGNVPTIWLSNTINGIDPAFIRRFDFIFELDIPKEKQRLKVLESKCGNVYSQEFIQKLAKHEQISPAVVERSTNVIAELELTSIKERESSLELVINNTLKAQGHKKLANNTIRTNDIYDTEFIQSNCNLDSVIEGLANHGSGRLCLYGPPGTGKTAFGHHLSSKLGKKIIVKKSSDLISMWVGGTEQNIAAAFECAKSEDAILMLDEVDSFLQERRNAKASWEITAVNEMLTQMESFDGIFIASTNLMDNLDQASIRRFDLKVKLDYMSSTQVERMFDKYCVALGIKNITLPSDIKTLSNITPGDFALIARQHKFNPIVNSHDFLNLLIKESSLKKGTTNKTIGFIH